MITNEGGIREKNKTKQTNKKNLFRIRIHRKILNAEILDQEIGFRLSILINCEIIKNVPKVFQKIQQRPCEPTLRTVLSLNRFLYIV